MIGASYNDNPGNIIQGIKLRANNILRSLYNLDTSNDPVIERSKALLEYIINSGSPNYIYRSRNMIYKLFSELEYSINQLENSSALTKSYSGMRSRGVSVSTVSGDIPRKAMPSGKKQKNSIELRKKEHGINISEYLPYIIIGGIGLFALYSGKKTIRR